MLWSAMIPATVHSLRRKHPRTGSASVGHWCQWICLHFLLPVMLDLGGGVGWAKRTVGAVSASAPSSLLTRDTLPDKSPPDPLQPRPPLRRGYLISVDQSINLTCPYKAPFYSWSLADQPAIIISDTQVHPIKQATVADSGRYTCQAVDGYGQNSAEIAVRVIDPQSYSAHRDCLLDAKRAVNLDGPCFFSKASERELNPSHVWGDSVVFNCDVVTRSGLDGHLIYRWEATYSRSAGDGTVMAVPAPLDDPAKEQRLFVRNSAGAGEPTALSAPPLPDLTRHRESKLKLDNLDLRHNGDYRCVVLDTLRSPLGDSNAGSGENDRSVDYPSSITRTFRLSVAPRATGPIIQGPRIINETVFAGADATFKCEVNPAEHRSSTIRWGKSIQPSQRSVYEAQGREVIQWTGGTFVVLPSVDEATILLDTSAGAASVPSGSSAGTGLSSSLKKFGRSADTKFQVPPTGALATETSASQTSRLLIRKASSADAGRYICSVLTEIGRDDHKFVHVTVVGGTGSHAEGLTGSGMRQLTVYIAVPTAICIICLCMVTYCLVVHRRSRNLRPGAGGSSRHTQNYFSPAQQQQAQLKSPSAASSCSLGVCRNGFGAGVPVPGGWAPYGLSATDARLRPSPVGTGVGTNTIAYSSTNGSNCPNRGQVVAPAATDGGVYANDGSVVPGPYSLLRQLPSHGAIGTSASPFYTVSNVSYPVDSGLTYPLANDHTAAVTCSHNPAETLANSVGATCAGAGVGCPGAILNSSSSPESSSAAAGFTGDSSLLVDGRMVFHSLPGTTSQSQAQQQPQQHSPHVYTPYSTCVVATDCTGAGLTSAAVAGNGAAYLYPHALSQQQQQQHHSQHHHLTRPADFDVDQCGGATPLLAFHSHPDPGGHNTTMRA